MYAYSENILFRSLSLSFSLSFFGNCTFHLALSPFHVLSLFHHVVPTPPPTHSRHKSTSTRVTNSSNAHCAHDKLAQETHAPRGAWVQVAESTCVTFGPQSVPLQWAYLNTDGQALVRACRPRMEKSHLKRLQLLFCWVLSGLASKSGVY